MKTEPLEAWTRRDGPFPLGVDEVVVEDTDVIRPSNSRSSEARRLQAASACGNGAHLFNHVFGEIYLDDFAASG
jgi:hypothetical protein